MWQFNPYSLPSTLPVLSAQAFCYHHLSKSTTQDKIDCNSVYQFVSKLSPIPLSKARILPFPSSSTTHSSYNLISVTKMLDSGDCSIMLRKFEECAEQEKLYEESISTEPFPPQLCGTLMDPDELAKVPEPGGTERPVTHPASILGYSWKMCSIYPSLVDGPSLESVIHGIPFEVTSRFMAKRILWHQISYVKHDCVIQLEDGENLPGVQVEKQCWITWGRKFWFGNIRKNLLWEFAESIGNHSKCTIIRCKDHKKFILSSIFQSFLSLVNPKGGLDNFDNMHRFCQRTYIHALQNQVDY